MPSGGGSSGGSLPAQWIIDPTTGAVNLALTLDATLQPVDAFKVTINDTIALRVFLVGDGTAQVSISDLNAFNIWRDESVDTQPTIQVLGQGEIRSRSLPTADPHVSGELWNNAGIVTVSAG